MSLPTAYGSLSVVSDASPLKEEATRTRSLYEVVPPAASGITWRHVNAAPRSSGDVEVKRFTNDHGSPTKERDLLSLRLGRGHELSGVFCSQGNAHYIRNRDDQAISGYFKGAS
jgi:hypothetical protein